MIVEDRESKVMRARVIPQTGQRWYGIVLTGIIESLGYNKLDLKSDQKAAIKTLKDAVKYEAMAEVLMGESPMHETKPNGEVEGAIQMAQGQLRAMTDRVE